MPKVSQFYEHKLIEGRGLDHVLDTGWRLLLIDDYYSEVYSDYVFLGYDTFIQKVTEGRADLVGLYAAASLLEGGKTVIVCGDKPRSCVYILAAYSMLNKNKEVEEALKEARDAVMKIYGEIDVGGPELMALRALRRLLKILHKPYLASLFAVALNYDFGENPLKYGEALAWLDALGAKDRHLLASALRFLVEGRGKPLELFNARVEALGLQNLVELVGDDALGIIRRFAMGEIDEDVKVYLFINKMRPGENWIWKIRREGERAIIKCKECDLEEAKALLPLSAISLKEIVGDDELGGGER